MTHNPTEITDVALRWAKRLKDHVGCPPDGVMRFRYCPKGFADITVEHWDDAEQYLSDHRNCARAIACARKQLRDPGITLGFDEASDAERKKMSAIEDAMRSAWDNPTQAMIDLDAALLESENERRKAAREDG